MMRVLDLFSGIGGFSLGLERAGFTTVGFCEIDPFCQRVLAKHWPGIPCWEDIRTLDTTELPAAELVCGGFPCTDLSVAGKGAGLDGADSGLWSDMRRVIGDLRPPLVVVENVAVLAARGLGRVLGDLAALGYDAAWESIPAAAIGAPHLRDRIWIVAYARDAERWRLEQERRSIGRDAQPAGDGAQGPALPHALGEPLRDEQQRVPRRRPRGVRDQGQAFLGDDGAAQPLADADRGGRQGERIPQHSGEQSSPRREPNRRREIGRWNWASLAYAYRPRPPHDPKADAGAGEPRPRRGADPAAGRGGHPVGDTDRARRFEQRWPLAIRQELAAAERAGWWSFEPDVGRVADGVPFRVDRLRGLGNSLVPPIAEAIGRAILAVLNEQLGDELFHVPNGGNTHG